MLQSQPNSTQLSPSQPSQIPFRPRPKGLLGPLGAPGESLEDPWRVPGSSLEVPGGPWWVPGGPWRVPGGPLDHQMVCFSKNLKGSVPGVPDANLVQFSSIQFSSVQFSCSISTVLKKRSPDANLVQFSSVQFSSIQFNCSISTVLKQKIF